MTALFFLLGLCGIGLGVLGFMAGAMSDDPEAADGASRVGCAMLAVGAVCVLGSVAMLWRAW